MKSRLDDNMALGLLALAYDGTADATFYEMSIMKTKFIQGVYDALAENGQK